MQQKKNRKRLAITVALVACLAAVAGFGTLAWLTAQDQATNVFTTGNFNDPGKDPGTGDGDDPENPDDEKEDDSPDAGTPDGYLTETAWENGSKLMPGVAVAKNPNVGIGANSDDAYIFIYVENNTIDSAALSETYGPSAQATSYEPYFTIESQWNPVMYEGVSQAVNTTSTAEGVPSNAYVSGLFVYQGGDDPENPNLFTPAKGENVTDSFYTGELFENVTVPNGTDMDVFGDNPFIKVYAYIYGADSKATGAEDGTFTAAVNAAVKWVGDLKDGE
ncbi:SipW-dependent-type signal peptide-containing protein [Collinsella tanakaei]|uniref:SipW-dependent-type signal peptide-containing protein n=1 Tax=Collinsella tanakaei TaxID=626935 RepID=UPI0025A450A0|nr:SipW-dependent-type signal peptide-containing protein [Collinsella tanakaei]MDM8246176.1 SipW-dependent-type signal peptide-containing protein [Collinsella tanakaei]